MGFFENFLGGAAEDHLECKKRSGIHSDRALLLNALPVPLLRQVYILVFFSCFFSASFPRLLFIRFVRFWEFLGVPRVVIFATFF